MFHPQILKSRKRDSLPAGCKHLEILRSDTRTALLLMGYNTYLTVAHGVWIYEPDLFVYTTGYAHHVHDEAGEGSLPVRLHEDNVLLLYVPDLSELPGQILVSWLDYCGWQEPLTFRLEEARSSHPVEDGFFRCLRICVEDSQPQSIADEPRLQWEAMPASSASLMQTLEVFISEEFQFFRYPEGCESYVWREFGQHCDRQHPAWKILRLFDDGVTRCEFAGAIISPSELRFWSRVASYHK